MNRWINEGYQKLDIPYRCKWIKLSYVKLLANDHVNENDKG